MMHRYKHTSILKNAAAELDLTPSYKAAGVSASSTRKKSKKGRTHSQDSVIEELLNIRKNSKSN
jgi:hypothetical protein